MTSVWKEIKWTNFIMLTVAGIVNAIGVTMFLAPVNLYDSGISGTSMLLWQITPEWLSLSFFLVVLNVPLFIFGTRKLGWEFTLYSVYAVLIYSGASYLIIHVLPVDVSIASPLAEQDLFLCALFGGLISGVGSGLTIRYGGAIDGVEVLSVIFAKRLGVTVGTFVMIYNVALYTLIGLIRQSWILPLYSIVTYAAGLKTVDFIVEGLDKGKAAMIITAKPRQVGAALSAAFSMGVTLMDAHGFYSDSKRTVVYFVVNRFQIAKMKEIIRRVDPGAFVTITEVAETLGQGALPMDALPGGKSAPLLPRQRVRRKRRESAKRASGEAPLPLPDAVEEASLRA